MKECWSEGDLRAYLDRELAPEEMERASTHLAECAECRGRSDVLAARARKVSVWMEDLEVLPVAAVPLRRSRREWKWVAAALGAAAAVVLAIGVARRPAPPEPRVARTVPLRAVEPDPPAPAMHEAAVLPERPRPPRVERPETVRTETFVALDNEPFEAGWVVRMALGPDQIQADVVFSADGRARAYRLVGNPLN